MVLDKGDKKIQWGIFINDAGCWTTRYLYAKKKEFRLLAPYTKITSEWIIGTHIRVKTIKLLGENTEVNLYDLILVNDFLDMKPKTQVIKDW